MQQSVPHIDPAKFRNVLGHYPTGVTIVTGISESGEVLAMVVGTFTSVSIEPPLVAFLPMKSSRTFQELSKCASVCVNVLTGDQEKLGRLIASRRENKLDGIEWEYSPNGAPILTGSLAWLDVRISDTIEAGDHWIAMCQVLDLGVGDASPPLIFFQGGYGRFMVKSLVARVDGDNVGPVRRGARARHILERVATELGGQVQLMAALSPHELVAVATAQGACVNATDDLGERVPMIPPIGDTYVAGGSDEDVEDWLSRGPRLEPHERDLFWGRIEFCRKHGYLASFLPQGGRSSYESMAAAAQRFAQGNLTPAEERDLSEAIARGAVGYEAQEIDDAAIYSIGSIVMPIPDENQRPIFTMRVSQLPADVPGTRVKQWIDHLRPVAQELSTALAE